MKSVLLKRLSWITFLISIVCFFAGNSFDNTDVKMFFLPVLILSGIMALSAYLMGRREQLSMDDDTFAVSFFKQLVSGEYFNSSVWQNAYRDYRTEYQQHRRSSLGIRTDLFIRCLRRLVVLNSVWMFVCTVVAGAANIPLGDVLKDLGVATADYSQNIGDRIIVTVITVPLIYLMVLCLVAFLKSKKWLDSFEEKGIGVREIETSYREGDAFECSINSVVIGPYYVHGVDGEKFYTVPRNMINAVAWNVDRFIISAKTKYGTVYKGDEYRFYIVFESGNGEVLFRIPLDQFQIRMIMDNYFPNEAAKSLQIRYEEIEILSHKFFSLKKHTSPVMMAD